MHQETVDYSKKWYVLLAVGMGVFMATVDASIINVALPTLVRAFNATFNVVQWVVLAYLLTLATFMLSMGRIADIIGKKKIYTTGIIVFILGSAMCGIEQTIYWLIAFRVLQGLGAVMMISLGTAILTESFPPQERGKALGSIGAFVSIGIITGPTLGGLIIEALSWHWIFFVNIPVGLVTTVFVVKYVPGTAPLPGQRFDFFGAIALFISLTAFLMAATLGQRLGFLNDRIIPLYAIWVIFFLLFLIIEWRVTHPMIDLHLFKNALFTLNLFTGFITFVCSAGLVLLMPFYLENVLGYHPRQVGLLLAIVPASAGIFSPLSGMLSDRIGTRKIGAVGIFIMLLGYIGLTQLNEHTTALGYILHFLPLGIGIGVFQSPNNSAIMGAAPRSRLGVVSGLLSITRTLGQSSGIAFLGAFWAGRVGHHSGHFSASSSIHAPVAAQVRGLEDTVVLTAVFMGLAFVLAILSIVDEHLQEKRQGKNESAMR